MSEHPSAKHVCDGFNSVKQLCTGTLHLMLMGLICKVLR